MTPEEYAARLITIQKLLLRAVAEIELLKSDLAEIDKDWHL